MFFVFICHYAIWFVYWGLVFYDIRSWSYLQWEVYGNYFRNLYSFICYFLYILYIYNIYL